MADRDVPGVAGEGPVEAGLLVCPSCGGPCAADARACAHCSVPLAGVRCRRCFALHFVGARFCSRCGKELEPEPLLDATGAPCPRCAKPLHVGADAAIVAIEEGGVAHECVGCGGVFVDRRLLERIAARSHDPGEHGAPPAAVATGVSAEDLERVRYLLCPVCRSAMNRVNFGRRSGVIVDVCRTHGTW